MTMLNLKNSLTINLNLTSTEKVSRQLKFSNNSTAMRRDAVFLTSLSKNSIGMFENSLKMKSSMKENEKLKDQDINSRNKMNKLLLNSSNQSVTKLIEDGKYDEENFSLNSSTKLDYLDRRRTFKARNIKDCFNEKISRSSRSDLMILDDSKPKLKLSKHNKIIPKPNADERKDSVPDFIKELQEISIEGVLY